LLKQALAVAMQLAGAEHAKLGICSMVDPIVIAGTAPPGPGMDLIIRDMEIEARRLVDEGIACARQTGLTATGWTHNGMLARQMRPWFSLAATERELVIPPEWTPVLPIVIGRPDESPQGPARKPVQIIWA
jgi:hypothetical protein